MSSPLPSASNGYLFQPDTPLSPEVFNGCFGPIKAAIDALEQVKIAFDLVEQAAIDHAHSFVRDSIAPQLATLAAAISALQALIAAAEDQLAALQNGGVELQNIAVPDALGLGLGTNLDLAETLVALKTAYEAADAALSARVGAVEANRMVVDRAASSQALLPNRDYLITAAAAAMLTLPAAPAAGDAIRLRDSGTITTAVQHTVARNGRTIMGLAENLVLDVRGVDLTLAWSGTDWRLS
ncbi:MAG: hypothetical protein C0447_09640 [Methylobacterium sp.]|nr:hypothetical protein [Methylobacterium sp.]